MQVSTQRRGSEIEFMEALYTLADAGGSVIHVRSREVLRAAVTLRKNLIASDAPYKEWDVVNGIRTFTKENFVDHKVAGDGKDFVEALMLPLSELRNPTSEVNATAEKINYFVYIDPHPFIKDNAYAHELLQQYAAILPTTNVCTILVTPDMSLPDIPSGTVLSVDLPTPSEAELAEVLRQTLSEIPAKMSHTLGDEDVTKVALLGLGMTLYEFETHCALSVIDASVAQSKKVTLDHFMRGIGVGKTAVVRQSEILELSGAESVADVGGMGRLKDWLLKRVNCYSPEAKSYGIEPPKGMVLAGAPGTGKSLVAKVTSSVFGVPLVRLDFGRVFSKYVGDSESRVRAALKMVEEMSPVVLFVDEIDKGLGGAGGGGDSGTSSRVLGSFLTWLQENKAPVFTVVTANRVDGLPPELLRRGRFDQIFSVGLPTSSERLQVLEIHLRKRGRKMSMFSQAELGRFTKWSDGYVPAEIESAVKDALIAAYDKGAKDLTMDDLGDALKELVPMSRSHKEAIERMSLWAKEHATPVSYPEGMNATEAATEAKPAARIFRSRAR